MRSVGWWSWMLVAVLCAPLAGGCKKQGPSPEDGVGGPDGAGALGEEGVGGGGAGGAGGSSLARAQQGLSPEEDGVLRDVPFGYDSYELEGEAADVVERNLRWLRENPRAKVEIEGHCDNRGTIEYNLALGAKRAGSVKDHLVEQGIDATRLSTISYGKELPVCSEETEACWARNRRAHLVVLGR